MDNYVLDEQMFRDFQEGLEDLKQLKQNPDDEVSRKRFEKKWGNHEMRDVLDLFLPADSKG